MVYNRIHILIVENLMQYQWFLTLISFWSPSSWDTCMQQWLMLAKSICPYNTFKTVALFSADFITTLKKQTHLPEFKCWNKGSEVLQKFSGWQMTGSLNHCTFLYEIWNLSIEILETQRKAKIRFLNIWVMFHIFFTIFLLDYQIWVNEYMVITFKYGAISDCNSKLYLIIRTYFFWKA